MQRVRSQTEVKMLTELAKAEAACVSVFRTAHPPSKEITFPECVDMMVPRKGERKGRGKEGRGKEGRGGVGEGERTRGRGRGDAEGRWPHFNHRH